MQRILFILTALLIISRVANAQNFKSDTLQTDQGPLAITFIGHATLYFEFHGTVVHVDPWSRLADYAALPKADLILITHDHRDHLDVDAVKAIQQEGTAIVLTQKCAEKIDGIVMHNGDERTLKGITVKAVPAYNIVNMRSENKSLKQHKERRNA